MDIRNVLRLLVLAAPLGACAGTMPPLPATEVGAPVAVAEPAPAVPAPAVAPAAIAEPGIRADGAAAADPPEARLMGVALPAELAAALEADDRVLIAEATGRALEKGAVGETLVWSNPATAAHGTVTPHERFQDPKGRICRFYELFVIKRWMSGQGSAEACRTVSGRWALPGDLVAPVSAARAGRF